MKIKFDKCKETMGIVHIKLLTDLKEKDINRNIFIMAEKEKKCIADMQKGGVIEFKVPAGKCRILLGNNIVPSLDSIYLDVSKDKTEVVGIESTPLGYLLDVL